MKTFGKILFFLGVLSLVLGIIGAVLMKTQTATFQTAALSTGAVPALVFVAAMLAGMAGHRLVAAGRDR